MTDLLTQTDPIQAHDYRPGRFNLAGCCPPKSIQLQAVKVADLKSIWYLSDNPDDLKALIMAEDELREMRHQWHADPELYARIESETEEARERAELAYPNFM